MSKLQKPFKFLDAYTAADTEIFFGREHEVEELYSHLQQRELFLLYGPSGCGKTSLLQCGLAKKYAHSIAEIDLQTQDYVPIFIRRAGSIKESMHFSLDEAAITPFKKGQSVLDKVYSIHLDYQKPIFLVFDQCEEIFIFGDDAEKDWFKQVIIELLKPDQLVKAIDIPGVTLNFSKDFHLILSIRMEYLYALTEFEDEIPDIFQNRYRLEMMRPGQAREAITGPCKVCDIPIEEELVDQLMETLTGPSGKIDLTFLQVILDRLYRNAENRDPESIRLTLKDFEKSGDLTTILSDFLDDQLRQMPDQEDGEAILKALVSFEGTKKPATIEDIQRSLKTFNKEFGQEVIKQQLQHFISARIINDKDDQGFFELRHDILASRIFARMSRKEKDVLEIMQLLESRLKDYTQRGILLDKDTLEFIAPYEKSIRLRTELVDLINRSRKQLLKQKRRIRRVVASSISFLVLVIVGFSIWALIERAQSMENEKVAKSSYFASEALRVLPEDNTKALRFAEAAYNLFDKDHVPTELLVSLNPISQSLFMRPIYDQKYIGLLPENSFSHFQYDGLKLACPSPNRNLIATAEHGAINLWDRKGNWIDMVIIHKDRINTITFSNDGNKILTSSYDGSIHIWNLESFSGQSLFLHKSGIKFACFSPDSDKILARSIDGPNYLIDLSNNTKDTLNIHWHEELFFTPISNKMICFQEGSSIRIFTDQAQLIREVNYSPGGYFTFSFSPDGKSFAAISQSGTPYLFSFSGDQIQCGPGPKTKIESNKNNYDEGETHQLISPVENYIPDVIGYSHKEFDPYSQRHVYNEQLTQNAVFSPCGYYLLYRFTSVAS